MVSFLFSLHFHSEEKKSYTPKALKLKYFRANPLCIQLSFQSMGCLLPLLARGLQDWPDRDSSELWVPSSDRSVAGLLWGDFGQMSGAELPIQRGVLGASSALRRLPLAMTPTVPSATPQPSLSQSVWLLG